MASRDIPRRRLFTAAGAVLPGGCGPRATAARVAAWARPVPLSVFLLGGADPGAFALGDLVRPLQFALAAARRVAGGIGAIRFQAGATRAMQDWFPAPASVFDISQALRRDVDNPAIPMPDVVIGFHGVLPAVRALDLEPALRLHAGGALRGVSARLLRQGRAYAPGRGTFQAGLPLLRIPALCMVRPGVQAVRGGKPWTADDFEQALKGMAGDYPPPGAPLGEMPFVLAAEMAAGRIGASSQATCTATFADGAAIYALPLYPSPLAVVWRSDVFAAAGVAPPAPDWTLAEFLEACAALDRVLKAGKAPDARSVVAADPVLGKDLWTGFVLGFGGTYAAAGRFDLDNPGARAGLGALADLLHRYSGPGPGVVRFVHQPYTGADTLDSRWRWARFPRMPVRPVIPTDYVGVGLRATAAPEAELAAAVAFMRWLYAAPQQALLSGAGIPPISTDADGQNAFWRGNPVGDWAEFSDYLRDWPPHHRYTGAVEVEQALRAAAQDPASLPDRLAQAAAAMNAWQDPAVPPVISAPSWQVTWPAPAAGQPQASDGC